MDGQLNKNNRNLASTLFNCFCCPRECKADRTTDKLGFCKSSAGFSVSSICSHHGEEPVLSGKDGICNIFFTHCNMQCIYCQNFQISDNHINTAMDNMTLLEIVSQIEMILNRGAKGVGFVSPSHAIPQMLMIMDALSNIKIYPVYVYNTNGYDKVEMIKSFEDKIDVYLPDFKYMDDRLAAEYSQTSNYVPHAKKAVKEMYCQKGVDITLDKDGLITNGLIIRHLVLPGHVENSKAVLRYIAEELSPDVYISLMSQYHPTPRVAGHPKLGRTVYPEEYEEVLNEFERLGFHRGFVQEHSSPYYYKPDFMKEHPFE